jgi:hypothetical protein
MILTAVSGIHGAAKFAQEAAMYSACGKSASRSTCLVQFTETSSNSWWTVFSGGETPHFITSLIIGFDLFRRKAVEVRDGKFLQGTITT